MSKLQKVVDVSLVVALAIFAVLLIGLFSMDDRVSFMRAARIVVILWLCSVVTWFFWTVVRARSR